MKTKRFLAMVVMAAMCSVAAADDDLPFDTLYAVRVLGSPFNLGMAFVLGPVHAESCKSSSLAWLKSTAEANFSIPPDMQLQANVCVRKDQLAAALNGAFICANGTAYPIKGAKYSKLWAYGCVWRF